MEPGRFTHGSVKRAANVVMQCFVTDCYVQSTVKIIKQCINTHGVVVNTNGVGKERAIAESVVERASGVIRECLNANRGVPPRIAGGAWLIMLERANANGGVSIA